MLATLLALTLFTQSRTEPLPLRDRPQALHLYGDPHGAPTILASGDGGWIRLAPAVAEWLASRGYFVLGLDSRAYLRSFTHGQTGLDPKEVPRDFATLLGRAARDAAGRRPVLMGVSEGAALAILAATDPNIRSRIDGVVALGVGDVNELAWRWKDAIIYLTKGVPNEPTFSVVSMLPNTASTPLAIIQSTHDEYVAPEETTRIVAAAPGPKRLWRVDASDHRFSNNMEALRVSLMEALAWMRDLAAGRP